MGRPKVSPPSRGAFPAAWASVDDFSLPAAPYPPDAACRTHQAWTERLAATAVPASGDQSGLGCGGAGWALPFLISKQKSTPRIKLKRKKTSEVPARRWPSPSTELACATYFRSPLRLL